MTFAKTWTNGRFTGAGPWPDGQYYVVDKSKSSICNPDTGKADSPWRALHTREEAEAAAAALNDLEGNHAMLALRGAAHKAREQEDDLTG